MPDGTQPPSPDPLGQTVDWEALARYVAGESSPQESAQLEARFAAQPADKTLIDALGVLTQRMVAGPPVNLDVEAALKQVKLRLNRPEIEPLHISGALPYQRRQVRWRVPFPAIAAVALLAAGLAGYLTLRKEPPGQPSAPSLSMPRMVATGVGALDSLRLPDGTRVVLGPLSSVKIADGYGVQRRDVDVRGDVWLDVVHDSSKPFTTHALGATIQDVGTRFSVRTDAAEGIAVSVREGAVSLRAANTAAGPGVILKSGSRGLILTNGQILTGPVTTDDMAWMRGQLVFREAPLSEVAASLRRWYGIDLQVADSSLASRHLTATFSGETPDRVLDVIRLALGARIERHGDTAIVRATDGGIRLK